MAPLQFLKAQTWGEANARRPASPGAQKPNQGPPPEKDPWHAVLFGSQGQRPCPREVCSSPTGPVPSLPSGDLGTLIDIRDVGIIRIRSFSQTDPRGLRVGLPFRLPRSLAFGTLGEIGQCETSSKGVGPKHVWKSSSPPPSPGSGREGGGVISRLRHLLRLVSGPVGPARSRPLHRLGVFFSPSLADVKRPNRRGWCLGLSHVTSGVRV